MPPWHGSVCFFSCPCVSGEYLSGSNQASWLLAVKWVTAELNSSTAALDTAVPEKGGLEIVLMNSGAHTLKAHCQLTSENVLFILPPFFKKTKPGNPPLCTGPSYNMLWCQWICPHSCQSTEASFPVAWFETELPCQSVHSVLQRRVLITACVLTMFVSLSLHQTRTHDCFICCQWESYSVLVRGIRLFGSKMLYSALKPLGIDMNMLKSRWEMLIQQNIFDHLLYDISWGSRALDSKCACAWGQSITKVKNSSYSCNCTCVECWGRNTRQRNKSSRVNCYCNQHHIWIPGSPLVPACPSALRWSHGSDHCSQTCSRTNTLWGQGN